MYKPDYKKAEQVAANLLENFNIEEPIVPVEEIAQREGVTIKYFKPNHDDNLNKVSGFYDPNTKTIYVNFDDSPSRRMFTIAHELGHMELKHKPSEFDVLYRFATPIDKDPLEQEANCFAANLLVPEKMLTHTMEKYDLNESDYQILAKMFGVSNEVMKYRLRWIKTSVTSS
ncbi:MAG: ImmA/IrrE family metallo-endopeptidase [Candidatus Nomurabacteria bacterium]|nr:ImmA/IrrE family metallo-endopeptidase [Candidatus Nomurabacteria bacterium]USN87683.1 MAG: ImmA/IrrE family metallo-endopeptidase [Candidatus Nomurabacteria bacterium]